MELRKRVATPSARGRDTARRRSRQASKASGLSCVNRDVLSSYVRPDLRHQRYLRLRSTAAQCTAATAPRSAAVRDPRRRRARRRHRRQRQRRAGEGSDGDRLSSSRSTARPRHVHTVQFISSLRDEGGARRAPRLADVSSNDGPSTDACCCSSSTRTICASAARVPCCARPSASWKRCCPATWSAWRGCRPAAAASSSRPIAAASGGRCPAHGLQPPRHRPTRCGSARRRPSSSNDRARLGAGHRARVRRPAQRWRCRRRVRARGVRQRARSAGQDA